MTFSLCREQVRREERDNETKHKVGCVHHHADGVVSSDGSWRCILSKAADKLDRTVLPIPEPKRPAITTFDARKATAPPRFEIKAPANAPNVLLVLIDDMGFGMSSAFGGPIHMPTVERLANEGLRYNHFHTTALCSPTTDGVAERPQPPHEQHGRDHRDCDMRFPATRASAPTTWRRSPRCCG